MVRLITSNKVRPRKEATFEEIVEEVFQKLPAAKLSPSDAIRSVHPMGMPFSLIRPSSPGLRRAG